jgi:hypothetical protein
MMIVVVVVVMVVMKFVFTILLIIVLTSLPLRPDLHHMMMVYVFHAMRHVD